MRSASAGTLFNSFSNMLFRNILLSAGLLLGATTAFAAPQQKAAKPHIIVTCDPELDDNNSMIRFLLYSSDFDVRGLIYASSQFHWKGDGKGTTWWMPGREYSKLPGTKPMTSYRYAPDERFIDADVDCYEKAYPNLIKHHDGYPSPAYLRSKIREGNVSFDSDMSKDTPGSELIKQELLDPDTTTLFLQVWGGASTIARALKSIEDIYSGQANWQAIKDHVSKKAVLCMSGDQDDTYTHYIHPFWPGIKTLEAGGMQVNLTFFGPITASEEDKVYYSPEWTQKNIRSKGAFGERYRVWGDGKQMVKGDRFDFFGVCELGKEELQRQGYVLWMPLQPKGTFISEGDTFCYLNMINNGLDAWKNQTWGGWTGARLDIPKDVDSRKVSSYTKEQIGFPDFTPAVQNGFAARMAWSVTPNYKDANHEPVIDGPATMIAAPGQTITLKCKVSDPDNNKVAVEWMQFKVGGTKDLLSFGNAKSATTTVTIPATAKSGEQLHAILQATDNGTPALTHYKRVIITVK